MAWVALAALWFAPGALGSPFDGPFSPLTSGAATGGLTQASGTDACIQVTLPGNEPSSRCAMATLGAGLSESSIVASYGNFVYVAGAQSKSPIEVLEPNSGGGLSDVQCYDFDGLADGGNGDCTQVAELDAQARDLVVSPNGDWVYETEDEGSSDVINVFARDSSTGELTWKSCISGDGNTPTQTGVCSVDAFPYSPGRHLAVNPVTGEVYTSLDGTTSWFSASQTTGALIAGGCVGPSCGTGGVDNSPLAGTGLGDEAIAVSADGKFLYAAPEDSDGVEWFPINSDGSLSVNTNSSDGATDGCLQDIRQQSTACGTGAAAQIRGLRNSEGTILLSPDAKSQWVYLLSSVPANVGGTTGFPGTILVLQRNPSTGALTQSGTADGCISSDGTDGESASGPCEQADPSLEDGLSIAESPDGSSLYVLTQGDNGVSGAADNGSTIEALGANTSTGALDETGPTSGAWPDCYGSPGSNDGFPGTSCNNTFFGLAGQASSPYGSGQLLAVSSDGAHLYAADGGDGGLAIFQRTLPPQYTVSATLEEPDGTGGNTVTASSSDSDATCSGASCTVGAGDTVTLTANPAAGYSFAGWGGSGDPCIDSTNLTCTISNVQGNVTSPIASFVKTLPPTVSSYAENPVGFTSETVTATVATAGITTTYSLEYGTSAAYGHTVPGGTLQGGTETVSFTLYGLTAGTTYDFVVVASNAGGSAGGGNGTFTTPAPLPAPAISPLFSSALESLTSARVSGEIDNPPFQGADVTYYVEYATHHYYESGIRAIGADPYNMKTGAKTVHSVDGKAIKITGGLIDIDRLSRATTYDYRIVAESSDTPAIAHSADGTFTTPPAGPVVKTAAPSSVSPSGATMEGTIDDKGDAGKYTFNWSATLPAAGGCSGATETITGSSTGNLPADNGTLAVSALFNTPLPTGTNVSYQLAYDTTVSGFATEVLVVLW